MTKLFPFSRFIVYGHSMLPTLKPGQEVLTFNWYYSFAKPSIGDLVVIQQNGKAIVKRIQKCFDRDIFVIGDNQKDSNDSHQFGRIAVSNIIGKVVYTT